MGFIGLPSMLGVLLLPLVVIHQTRTQLLPLLLHFFHASLLINASIQSYRSIEEITKVTTYMGLL